MSDVVGRIAVLMDGEQIAAEEYRAALLEVDRLRGALKEYDVGDRQRPHLLHNLANALDTLFQITDDDKIPEEALNLRKTATALASPDDPLLPLYKYELACSLSDLFDDTGDIDHLRSSVSLLREVTESPASSDDLPARFDLLLQYALKAQVLFGITKREEDIDASIAAFVAHTEAIPDSHRTRKLARCYWMTASALLERHMQFPSNSTLDEAFALLEQSSKVPGATSFDALNASILWALAAKDHKHPSEMEAYKQAFVHYSQFIWFGYGLRIRHSRLKSSDERLRLPVRAAECAIRFGRFEQAVEWLDEGRSMLWGQMSKLRSSVDSLRKVYPELARRLELAGQALEKFADDEDVDTVLPRLRARPGTTQPYSRLDVSDVSEVKAQHIAEWNSVLEEIHATPEFSTFLMPRSYSELKEISKYGPVVIINLVDTSCDVLILPTQQEPIIHLQLPKMTEDRALYLKKRLLEALRVSGRRGDRSLAQYGRKDGKIILRSVLAELWSSLVEPVLCRLGLTSTRNSDEDGNLPRVWWCPTGALIDLPIHAAGLYDADGSSSACVSDYIISSYAPRLSTLIPPGDDYSFTLSSPKTLAIGQAQAQGASPLPGTTEELGIVRQICGQNVTSLEGEQANMANVLAELLSTELVHFACHGEQSKLEFDSGLILYDGRLQLSELIRQRVPNGRLAFLSACETAKGGLETPDEVMNIASAMLFAGFKSVVGTLWSINDTDGPIVAEAFYTFLFQKAHHGSGVDTRDAAIALHLAVKKLRDTGAPLVQWVPFIHLGV